MSELGKPHPKNSNKKLKQNQSQTAESEQKTTSEKRNCFIQKTRPRMNYKWIGKPV